MASTFSPSLKLELIATGEQSGTWGVTTNTNLGTLLEQAIAGFLSKAQGDVANLTLTSLDGASDEARNMVIDITGALTAARNVVVPTAEKFYLFKNSTTGGYAITVKTSGGSGVSIAAGTAQLVYCDGTNVVQGLSGTLAVQTAASVAITGGTIAGLTTLTMASGAATPATNDAAALGTATLMWSDLFLASGGVINWNNGDVTLTHSADALTMASGNFYIGDAISPAGVTVLNSMFSTNTATGYNTVLRKSVDAAFNAASLGLIRSRGTNASPTVLQSGDTIGAVQFRGYDGTNYIPAASISVLVNGTPGTNDMPGAIAFYTTADGAATSTERMRIASTGAVGIGTSNTGQGVLTVYSGTAGSPATSGSEDANIAQRMCVSNVALDFGTYDAGGTWIQNRLFDNYSINYPLHLQPNGAGVIVGVPTGSDKGTGTVNATGLYVNGVPVGFTLLATLTTTSNTTQGITAIASGYRALYFELEGVSFTTAVQLTLAISTDNTNYGTAVNVATILGAASNTVSGTIWLYGVSASNANAKSVQPLTNMDAGSTMFTTISRIQASGGASGAITAVRFAGGTFDAGTIRIYGVA